MVRRNARPLSAQILSISCSFQKILAKSYIGAPPPPRRIVGVPPRGNPGSDIYMIYIIYILSDIEAADDLAIRIKIWFKLS